MSAPLTDVHLSHACLPPDDLFHHHPQDPQDPPLELCTEYTEEDDEETALSRPMREAQAFP